MVVNRVLPDLVADPYFERWRTIQKAHLDTLDDAFAEVGRLKLRLFDDERVGVDRLRVMASEPWRYRSDIRTRGTIAVRGTRRRERSSRFPSSTKVILKSPGTDTNSTSGLAQPPILRSSRCTAPQGGDSGEARRRRPQDHLRGHGQVIKEQCPPWRLRVAPVGGRLTIRAKRPSSRSRPSTVIEEIGAAGEESDQNERDGTRQEIEVE